MDLIYFSSASVFTISLEPFGVTPPFFLVPFPSPLLPPPALETTLGLYPPDFVMTSISRNVFAGFPPNAYGKPTLLGGL